MKFVLLIGGLALIGASGCSETNSPGTAAPLSKMEPQAVSPTNTAVNVRDRSEAAKSPIDQNENQPDIDLTATIRKRVVGEEMSMDAHNVKIISQDGRVTLRGPVKSAEEKTKIEAIAQDVAGKDRVESQLEVAP